MRIRLAACVRSVPGRAPGSAPGSTPGRAPGSSPAFARSIGLPAIAAFFAASSASAQVMNVDATFYGYAAPTEPAPAIGQVVAPITNAPDGLLLQLALPAGTYSIRNATGLPGADLRYTAYRFNSNANWRWDVVLVDDATHRVVFYAEAGGVQATQAAVAAALDVQNLSGTFTLAAATTLDFMVRDSSLVENNGGVAVIIAPSPCPADIDDDGDFGTGLNPDGGVDINDLLSFLVAFEGGDLGADLDDDGDPAIGRHDQGVDINDLLFFLARFENGC